MARAETEREQYARLHAKYGGRKTRQPDPDDEDDEDDDLDDDDEGGIFMFTGRRADSFLSQIFGPGEGKRKKTKPAPEPDDDDDGEEPDEEEEPDEPDEPPARGHRYFRPRGQRG